MLNIIINRDAIEIGSRGAIAKLDLSKLSPAIAEQLFIYGVTQKISDAASTAGTDAAKLALGEEATKPQRDAYLETDAGKRAAMERAATMMQKAIDTLYSGEWSMREGTGQRMLWTDAQALAIETAKGDLLALFKAACAARKIKGTMENFVTLGESVAKYFETKAKKLVWADKAVMDYITKQAEASKRDYIAEAQATLDARAEQVAEIDLGDLLADI